MKTALIPPLGWERYLSLSTGVLMALAVKAPMNSVRYVTTFADLAFDNYVILDNGEAEGARTHSRDVVDFGMQVHADEIVLPDVIGNRLSTVKKVHEFFRNGNYRVGTRYMAVAQGDTIDQVKRCIDQYVWFTWLAVPGIVGINPINTIGIPRHIIQRTGMKGARIDIANWIWDTYKERFQVHLLGASTLWPQEVRHAAKYAPSIRSIDTSLPFNYAIGNVDLAELNGAACSVSRSNSYLAGTLPINNEALVKKNIDTYLEWAS